MDIGLFAKDRPVLDLERSTLEILAEVLAALGLALMVGVALLYQGRLPAVVPTQFGLDGTPDAWGPRWTILVPLPIVTVFVWALLTLVGRIPHRHNYLWKVTPENAAELYRASRDLLALTKAATVWLFATLLWNICRVAAAGGGRFWWEAMVAFLVLETVLVVVCLRRMRDAAG